MAAFDERDVTQNVQYARTERVQTIIFERREEIDVDGQPQTPMLATVVVVMRENGHDRHERRELALPWPPPAAIRSYFNNVIDNARIV